MNELEKELVALKSFDAADSILEGVKLHPLQIVDVLKMIYSKRAVVRYDTGTGKTLLAAAAMKLLWNENPSRKFIMFVKKDQCLQTPKKLQDALRRPVIATAANEKSLQEVVYSGKWLQYPLVLFTHDCLKNVGLMREVFSHRNEFCGVIIDEAHTVNNKGFAQSADVIAGLVSQFEFCWALTATPILTNPMQLAKLASVVDPKRYPKYPVLAKALAKGQYSITQDPLFFINRTAEELGRFSKYIGRIIWVDAMKHQQYGADSGGNPLALWKGEGAVRQAETLVNLLKAMKGKRGLVYVRQHAIRHWIEGFLQKAGIKYDCINGEVVKERPEIIRKFNEEKSLDVLLTSVTTAIDADCDYVVFYEFTVELKQMIGRADRGLMGKTVDVFYLLTRGSDEPAWFKEKIYDRDEMIRSILGTESRELDSVFKDLESEVLTC